MTSPVNVDVKLDVNKFNVDEEHPHIVVKADADKTGPGAAGESVPRRSVQEAG
ncbi:ferredoxin-like protein [Escherichia coli]|nr:ferredoxin-like protein [Escherichia coli]